MAYPLTTVRRLFAALLLAATMTPAHAAAQQTAAVDLDALRRQVLERFEVVPLRAGVALAGRDHLGRVEIVDGLVLDAGTPLSGAELRTRLGADAGLVLRLSYLDNDALRALFGGAPGSATPSPAVPAPAAASPPAPGAEAVPPSAPSADARPNRRTGVRMALGRGITIGEDEEVTDGVVAIGGGVRIAGRVGDDVVALGGSVELLSTADVRGDITALGGRVTIAPGARHTGTVHQADVREWRHWPSPAAGWAWTGAGGAGRWFTLAGTLTRVGVLMAAVCLVALLARGRVARIGAAAAAAPWRAGAIGLGVQVLFVPLLVAVAIGLAVTVIGLPFVVLVIPLALVAMFVAMLLGFTGLAHRVGSLVARRFGLDAPATAGAAALGVGVIVLPTVASRLVGVAPDALDAATFVLLTAGTVLEYVTWTIGLGAAVTTRLGRWATAPPPVPGPDAA